MVWAMEEQWGWIPTRADAQSTAELIRDLKTELDILRKTLTGAQDAGNKAVEAKRKAEDALAKESANVGRLQTEVDALNSMINEAKDSLYHTGNTMGDVATRAKGALAGHRRLSWELSEAEKALVEAKKTTSAWLPVMQFCTHSGLPLHCDILEAYRRYMVELKLLVKEIPYEQFPMDSTETVESPKIRPRRYVPIRCRRCSNAMRFMRNNLFGPARLFQCTACSNVRWIQIDKLRVKPKDRAHG